MPVSSAIGLTDTLTASLTVSLSPYVLTVVVTAYFVAPKIIPGIYFAAFTRPSLEVSKKVDLTATPITFTVVVFAVVFDPYIKNYFEVSDITPLAMFFDNYLPSFFVNYFEATLTC